MAAVPQTNSSAERALRTALFKLGLRYRINLRGLPGTPDIVLPKHRLVIFVHGCFWHRHTGCPRATTPSTRRDFWLAKFTANVERDWRKRRELRALGWKSLVVWECQVIRSAERAAGKVVSLLKMHSTSRGRGKAVRKKGKY